MPAGFLKQVIDIVDIVNKSLSTEIVPDSLKCATISPILKKSSLDASIVSNFSPVSNLPFLSKLCRKLC